jgi:hypothetical protein
MHAQYALRLCLVQRVGVLITIIRAVVVKNLAGAAFADYSVLLAIKRWDYFRIE